MKKMLYSTKFTPLAINIALLIFRIGVGVLTIPHGYAKLQAFPQKKDTFMNFLGLGSEVSLALAIFAELICSVLIIVGLFTRFAALSLFITFCVIVFKAHYLDFFGKGELGSLYLICYTFLLLVGPGKFSVDKAIGG
jgi:putative oxidoreductase